jgi:hypothetical protein
MCLKRKSPTCAAGFVKLGGRIRKPSRQAILLVYVRIQQI